MSPAEKRSTERAPTAKKMQAKIGQLVPEVDFFGSRARSGGRCERKAMLIKIHPLAVKRQAELLEIPIVYYLPAPTPEQDLAIERERTLGA
jgi:hypothetical protein